MSVDLAPSGTGSADGGSARTTGAHALSPSLRPRKSASGHEELRSRAIGLSPRLRQLLILVDGVRDLAALARYFPGDELPQGIATLRDAGLILTDEPIAVTSVRGRLGAPATGDRTVVVRAGRAGPSAPIVQLRRRLADALRARVGAGADPFVERLDRCHTVAEMRELMPAMLAIVEVVAGADAAREFAVVAGLPPPGVAA